MAISQMDLIADNTVCQDREDVIARQAGEILQDLILTHTARQVFENIGGVIRVPTMQGLPLRTPGVIWMYCCQFMCFPACA